MITTVMPSVRRCIKASKEKTAERYMYEAHKEMSRAVGVKKLQEAQKAKAFWKMKAAKEAGEEYYDPEREDNILGRNKTRCALWEEHTKDPIVALDNALKCVENSYWRSRSKCSLQYLWEKPIWEGVWSFLYPMDSVFLRTESVEWNVPGQYGPHGELFFFLMQKELATVPGSETFSPFFNADIRPPSPRLLSFSRLMSSRSARLSPCT